MSHRYQFNQLTIVDGVLIGEYGNIEYLIIDEPFAITNLDPNLYDEDGKHESDGIDIFLDLDSFNCDELKEMGLCERYIPEKNSSKTESIDPPFDELSLNTLSLDEQIAMQLQFGDDIID